MPPAKKPAASAAQREQPTEAKPKAPAKRKAAKEPKLPTAVTAKPETSSTVEVVAAALKQIASVQKGIPNVYLQS